MKLEKTLEEYKKIVFTILTNISCPITFSQMVNLIQEIYCIDNYSEVSSALHNLVSLGILHQICAPDYYVELADRGKTKKSAPASHAINEKIFQLIPEGRNNAIDYEFTYTDRFPISLVRYFDYLRQEHTGLLKGDQAHLLLSYLDFEPGLQLTDEYSSYMRNYKKDNENLLYHLFADSKDKFRLKNWSYEKDTKTFNVTLYLLPGNNHLYPDISSEAGILINILNQYMYVNHIEILAEKL